MTESESSLGEFPDFWLGWRVRNTDLEAMAGGKDKIFSLGSVKIEACGVNNIMVMITVSNFIYHLGV